jgi:hypothetical protein
MCERVVLLLDHWPGHDLRTGRPHGRVWRHGASALIIDFSALFEEDLAEDVLFFGVRVIVLNIVVVRLVEHTRAVVIAVGILITNTTHLILKLGLGWHASYSHAARNCSQNLVLWRA